MLEVLKILIKEELCPYYSRLGHSRKVTQAVSLQVLAHVFNLHLCLLLCLLYIGDERRMLRPRWTLTNGETLRKKPVTGLLNIEYRIVLTGFVHNELRKSGHAMQELCMILEKSSFRLVSYATNNKGAPLSHNVAVAVITSYRSGINKIHFRSQFSFAKKLTRIEVN